ncbi:hypothetical protein [Lentzea sp. NPDC059081]|uniref:hypothetical protein n=1 Tax=Lentzea sp. NPDC059081 TaxID=3346719 RepID=UPI0036ADCB72
MEFWGAAAALLSLPLCLAGFVWFAVRARRGGGGQSLMSPFEEIWDPIAHRTNIEIQREAKRSPQAPAPGDPPLVLRPRLDGPAIGQ